MRNRRFDKNIDIFHHLMLFLLPMALFPMFQRKYVFQTHYKHTMSKTIHRHLEIWTKWNIHHNFDHCLHLLTLFSAHFFVQLRAKVHEQRVNNCPTECSTWYNVRRDGRVSLTACYHAWFPATWPHVFYRLKIMK